MCGCLYVRLCAYVRIGLGLYVCVNIYTYVRYSAIPEDQSAGFLDLEHYFPIVAVQV